MFETVKSLLENPGKRWDALMLIECLTTLQFNGYHPGRAYFFGVNFW
jgi:hypothetical protein